MELLAPVPKTIMGQVAQADEPWLRFDANYPAQMRHRFCTLAIRQKYAIDRIKSSEVFAAQVELRDMVVNHVLTQHPDFFERRGKRIINHLTGVGVDLKIAQPMVAISQLTNADMLLMLPSESDGKGGHVYRLMSGALLQPNYWSLRSRWSQQAPVSQQDSERAARLGKSVEEIHRGAVPHFEAHFIDSVNRLFNTLPPGRMFWRRNWGLPLTDQLFLHPDANLPELPELTPQSLYTHGHVRSEHETFVRLPQTRAIVFGIQTYVWPVRDMLESPRVFNALATAIDNTSPEMRAYGDRAEKLEALKVLMQQRGTPKPATP